MRSKPIRGRDSALLAAVALIAVSLAPTAQADVETMTPQTPTIIGGQVIGAGHLAIGASTGYPGFRGHFVFGIGSHFDLAIQPELTYANGWLSGLNQGFGLNVDVPLRFTLATMPRASLALRVVPYIRVGRASPSWGTGGTIGLRASIPLPKLFSIVVGAESRMGLGNYHVDNCDGSTGIDCNDSYFEGATYLVVGLETFFRQQWYFFGEHEVGAAYTSGGGYVYGGCGTGLGDGCSNVHAYFNAQFGFGYQIR